MCSECTHAEFGLEYSRELVGFDGCKGLLGLECCEDPKLLGNELFLPLAPFLPSRLLIGPHIFGANRSAGQMTAMKRCPV